MQTLNFTHDSNLRSDLFLKKRHYVERVEPKVAFFTDLRLAKNDDRCLLYTSDAADE